MIVPVILCGGAGSRLWPLSRKNKPKPFLKLFGDKSLLQMTADRALECSRATPQSLMAVTNEGLLEKTKRHLVYEAAHVLGEPDPRNTAAAIAMAAGYADRTFGASSILWVMPSDHIIGDHGALRAALKKAVMAAENGSIVTFGIKPHAPETAYGYIQLGPEMKDDVCQIEKFTEKPEAHIAKRYLNDGNHLWNSGMFMFKTSVIIREFEKLAPEYQDILQGRYGGYEDLPALPFDKAIMEKTMRGAVVPCDPGWQDIGNWGSLIKAMAGRQKLAA